MTPALTGACTHEIALTQTLRPDNKIDASLTSQPDRAPDVCERP